MFTGMRPKLGITLQDIMGQGGMTPPYMPQQGGSTPPYVPAQAGIAPEMDVPKGFLAPGGKGAMIAGILGDGLARASGGEAVFLPMMAAQQRDAQRAQQEQVQWDRRRTAEREDKQWEWQNKPREDDPYTRMMRQAGIDPNSEQGRALYRNKVEREGDPDVMTTLPNGQFYAGPRSGLVQALTGQGAPPAQPRRLGPVVNSVPGGAGGNVSGGFRP